MDLCITKEAGSSDKRGMRQHKRKAEDDNDRHKRLIYVCQCRLYTFTVVLFMDLRLCDHY